MVSRDSIYVTFPVVQCVLLNVEEAAARKVPDRPWRCAPTGQINFVDVQVDQATETVLVLDEWPEADLNGVELAASELSIAMI